MMARSLEPGNLLLFDDNDDNSCSKFENVSLLLVEKSKNNHYDIILMDNHMPLMSGCETIRKIRNELAGLKKFVPIISFSASLTEVEKKEILEAGADSLVEKTFEATALHDKIEMLIYRNRMAFIDLE
jgi:DNA-binding response OmpR family regulator